MELIFTYKILCIVHTVVKPRLITIFKERWSQSAGKEFEANVENGSILVSSNIDFYSSLNEKDQLINKQLIERGLLHKFHYSIIVKILLNTLSKRTTSEINTQNRIIQSLLEYGTMFVTPKDENQYKEQKKELIHLIKLLDETIKTNNKRNIPVEEEIENKLMGKQEESEINIENEKKAKEIKERGNKEYSKCNFNSARTIYLNALELEGLSNETISILYLNLSTNCFDYYIKDFSSKFNIIQNDYKDYDLLEKSIHYAKESLIHRPLWVKAYYRYAKVSSKLATTIPISIHAYDAVCKLSPEMKSEGEKGMTENIKKLQIRGEFPNGKRDFHQETINKIKFYGDIKRVYGKLKIDEQFILKTFDQQQMEFIEIFTKFGFKPDRALEKYLYIMTQELRNDDEANDDEDGKDQLIYDYLSRCVGNGTEWSSVYFELAEMYRNEKIVKYNGRMIVSLLLQGTLCPLEQEIKPEYKDEENVSMFAKNTDLLLVHGELGRIYRQGLHGEDIDIEKALYHLEFACSRFDKVGEIHKDEETSSCFYLLGWLYYSPLDPMNKTPNLEKAKDIWKQGVTYGSISSYNALNRYFKDDESIVKFLIDNKPTESGSNKQVDFSNYGANMGNEDLLATKVVLDFDKIKMLSTTSEYAKAIYAIHGLISKFFTLWTPFRKLTKKQKQDTPLNEKLEIIKPLASAYKQLEYFNIIRIPRETVDDIIELVEELLEAVPNSINTRVCWLGLKRLDGKPFEKLQFSIESSIKYCNETDESNEGQSSSSIFKYYQCVFYTYLGRFNELFKFCLKYSVEQDSLEIDSKYKDIFTYYLLLAAGFLDDSEILKHLNANDDTHKKQEIIEKIISNTESYISRSPIDSPINGQLYFGLSLLLSKCGGYSNDKILNYYEKGLEAKKTAFFYFKHFKLEQVYDLAKQNLLVKNIK